MADVVINFLLAERPEMVLDKFSLNSGQLSISSTEFLLKKCKKVFLYNLTDIPISAEIVGSQLEEIDLGGCAIQCSPVIKFKLPRKAILRWNSAAD